MSTLILSDFRGALLKNYTEVGTISYLIEDGADYFWFKDLAAEQLPLILTSVQNVIIMLGFNDCVYSCVWKYFNIDTIIGNYAKTINELIKQYTSTNFYVCSVAPVDSDYPFADYEGGVIQKEDLNKKIKQFNSKLKTTCNTSTTFIDCYDYLVSTGFSTRDGVRYLPDTCINLISFLTNYIGITGDIFEPRLSAPITAIDDNSNEDTAGDSDTYWVADSDTFEGGLNPFPVVNLSSGDTLPNCTAYAWGRFYEILGTAPKLVVEPAEHWFGAGLISNSYEEMSEKGTAYDGYERGMEPRLGAIICWEGVGDSTGHVAVVEQINDDGSILTSESSLNDKRYWWTTSRSNKNNNWGADANYKFQGFIYNPAVMRGSYVVAQVDKEDLYTKNEGLKLGSIKRKTDDKSLNTENVRLDETTADYIYTPSKDVETKMSINARYIGHYLTNQGWTLNAIAALLGNLQKESSMSPNRIETSEKVSEPASPLPSKDEIEDYANRYRDKKGRFPGFGITQWTSSDIETWNDHKLVKWCESNGLDYRDIDSQLQRITYEAKTGIQWSKKKSYEYKGESFSGFSFKEFITSKKDPGWLAAAFAFCYERPKSSTQSDESRKMLSLTRDIYATYWYNHLSGLSLEDGLKISAFKADFIDTTSVKLSVVLKNCKKADYIFDDKRVPLAKVVDGFNTFTLNDLIPNTEYNIKLEAFDDGGQSITKTISFTTRQDYPNSIESLKLICADKIKDVDSLFKLEVTKPTYLGYWKSNRGYDLQLIVNGKSIKTLHEEVKDIKESFTIKKKFGYGCKIGDIIQIGIRVWVKDDNDELVYDQYGPKTSEPICLLNKPIQVYLNA